MLVQFDGFIVSGVIVSGLSPVQWSRIDSYESVFAYSVKPLMVTRQDGTSVQAMAYRPPGCLESSSRLWDFDRWLAKKGPVTLFAAAEIAAHDPPLSAESVRRQWHMINGRAAAQVRAQAASAPAMLRRAAVPADMDIRSSRPLDGQFFKLAGMSVRYRQFGGGMSEALPREVLIGADAALVLPYDPVRDRVLLVEQFRPAAARRGDPNPWTLEPVAGMIDAGETPEQAARRESAEEAGLTLLALQQMFAIYASPGSTTDHFYCFLGLADLPDTHPAMGGLAEEHEDLRLHILPLDAALALIGTGEINVGPLVAMLLWAERERGRL